MFKYFLIFIMFTFKTYSQDLSYAELNGLWKIKNGKFHQDTSFNPAEYLRINYNKIQFFRTELDKEVETSVRKFYFLDFIENDIKDSYNGGQLIKFENGEIWELKLEKKNNEIRLMWEFKKTKDGEYVVTLDERHLIKDPEKRKKALETEIKTYCTKID